MNLIVEENDIHLLHIRDMDDDTPGYIISGTRPGHQSGLTPEMARLIAAAPDLLAALEEIANICHGPAASRAELAHEVYASARAAIQKAEGKEHHEP